MQFISNYHNDWRSMRLDRIISYYGEHFFKDITILELGCFDGAIGIKLIELFGCNVHFADVREGHLKNIKHPTFLCDLNNEWPFTQKYDLILNMGLLYHLHNPKFCLEKCTEFTDNLVIETEILDTNKDDIIYVGSISSTVEDQAIDNKESRPSPSYIENILINNGFINFRIYDKLDSMGHIYNWAPLNDGTYMGGKRAFWFSTKRKSL